MARTTAGGLVAVVLALLLCATAQAHHPPGAASGRTVVTLGGAAAKQLGRAGVRFVGVAPSAATRRKLTFAVTTGQVSTALTRAFQGGVVQAVRGKRRVAITGGETFVTATSATMMADVGRVRVPLLSFRDARATLVDATGTATLRAPVMLTADGAKALRRALGVPRLRAGRLGSGTFAITMLTPYVGPGPAPAPAPAPAPEAPPVTPGTVTSAAFTWRPRESFVRYISTGEGGTASAGATALPPEVRPGSSAPLFYAFAYPFAAGTTAPEGTSLSFGGTVTFRWAARGIDLAFSGPVLSIGATASATFTFAGAPVRALDLNLAAAAAHTSDGATETYTDVPATLTAEGAAAFQGFYAAGEAFGTVTATWTRTP